MEKAIRLDELYLARAAEDDLERVHSLWADAFAFMQRNGINQWIAEQVTYDAVKYVFDLSEMFLVLDGEEAVGTFFLVDSDEALWGGETKPGEAGYLHRLVVDRRHAGRGIGARMLQLAEQYLAERGKGVFRLDCMADNPKLNEFYRSAGFTFIRRVDGDGWSANLYEKKVDDKR
ncbi:GNAT family N-acetyltransferase [Paenibacillus thermotolerans]|uniref:GNAT family N-acetyltransferase n=1 Tax=Paenibacillus thermotolerans TaxID=3027807 RepID=UPI002367E1CE|nr:MULTISPECIES: GNAT family N-acetyltransferase [unclassified Paenibacillus]